MEATLSDYLELMLDINRTKKVDNDCIRDIVNIVAVQLKNMSSEELEKLCILREKDKEFMKKNFAEIWNMVQKD